MYKKAAQLKLRFQTKVGLLSVEQLWDLPQSELAFTIKVVKKILAKDNDDDLNFLDNISEVDAINQLRFDILKDVYMSRKAEVAELKEAADKKAFNQKIDALIAEKQEGKLREMTIEDLEKLRK